MKRISLIALAVLLLCGCQILHFDPAETTAEGAEHVKITPEEARAMMADGVVVLDVRTQAEYEGGHIRDAVLLPDNEISERAAAVLPDKGQTILVYCRSGRRSEAAARLLISMGYTRVYDFGGIVDWPGEVVK